MEKNNPSNPLRTMQKLCYTQAFTVFWEQPAWVGRPIFFLGPSSKTLETHTWPRRLLKAARRERYEKRETLFFSSPAATLVSRVERHLAGVHSPYTKCEKKETAHSLEEFLYWSIYLAWISDNSFGSFSPLSNWESEGVKTTGSHRLKFRLQSTPTSCQSWGAFHLSELTGQTVPVAIYFKSNLNLSSNISQILNSMHEGDSFSSKPSGKKSTSFKCQCI